MKSISFILAPRLFIPTRSVAAAVAADDDDVDVDDGGDGVAYSVTTSRPPPLMTATVESSPSDSVANLTAVLEAADDVSTIEAREERVMGVENA